MAAAAAAEILLKREYSEIEYRQNNKCHILPTFKYSDKRRGAMEITDSRRSGCGCRSNARLVIECPGWG